MKFKRIFVLFAFTFLLNTVITGNALFDLIENIAGVRDFFFKIQVQSHVKANERDYSDFLLTASIAIRNLEDFYFLIEEPEEFSELSFTYYSRTKRLYSRFPGYEDIDTIELPIEAIVNGLDTVLKILETPIFTTKIDEKTVTIYPVVASLMKSAGIEPVILKIGLSDGKISTVQIFTLDSDEYVRIDVLQMIVNANVDRYF